MASAIPEIDVLHVECEELFDAVPSISVLRDGRCDSRPTYLSPVSVGVNHLVEQDIVSAKKLARASEPILRVDVDPEAASPLWLRGKLGSRRTASAPRAACSTAPGSISLAFRTAGVLTAARRTRMTIVYLQMGYRPGLSDLGAPDAPNRCGTAAARRGADDQDAGQQGWARADP